LTGESGIGKSALLDEISKVLKEQKLRPFVGYYSREKSLIAESESFIYPFRIVLENLIADIVESQNLREQLDIALSRIKKGLIKYAKEQGKKIGLTIIEDLARKVGLEQTLKIGKEIIKEINSENTGILSAQSFIAEHRSEVLESYIDIFRMLVDEFKGREFVLIFDQFEHVGKTSVDFFLNMSKFLMLKSGFHIIVSFKTDEKKSIDASTKSIFDQIKYTITRELKGQIITLNGLSPENIGEWIKSVRGIPLPITPDLKRIRENSSGLPLILGEWIESSENLKDYDKIRRDHLCEQFIKLKNGLNENFLKNLYKASILLYPIQDDYVLANYFGMKDLFELDSFLDKMVESDIFAPPKKRKSEDSYSSIWFRHEIIQNCFADNLGRSLKKQLHKDAANFFMGLMKGSVSAPISKTNTVITDNMKDQHVSISVSEAYHIHESGIDFKGSYQRNRELAIKLSKAGDLDLAEKCYNRAIIDAHVLQTNAESYDSEQLNLEIECLNDLARDVYITWGRYDEALKIFEKSLSFYKQKGIPAFIIATMSNIGEIYFKKGDIDKALELFEQSLELSKKVGDESAIANIKNNPGLVNQSKGDYDKALELFEQSLEKGLSDISGAANTLNNMGSIYQNRGEYDKALKLYERCIEFKRITGDEKTINTTLNNIGMIWNDRREYDKALELFEQSLELSKRAGDIAMVGRTLTNMGMIFSHTDKIDKALELYKQSLELSKRAGDIAMVGRILNNIGLICYDKRDFDQALKMYDQSLEILKAVGDQFAICRTLNNIADIKCDLGDYDKALELYNECLAIVNRMGDVRGVNFFSSVIKKTTLISKKAEI
jgi:tetratricopeptide (TPR) repeat protein